MHCIIILSKHITNSIKMNDRMCWGSSLQSGFVTKEKILFWHFGLLFHDVGHYIMLNSSGFQGSFLPRFPSTNLFHQFCRLKLTPTEYMPSRVLRTIVFGLGDCFPPVLTCIVTSTMLNHSQTKYLLYSCVTSFWFLKTVQMFRCWSVDFLCWRTFWRPALCVVREHSLGAVPKRQVEL